MSMLAHDSYETEYEYADCTANGIKTKSNVLRGWPAFFYAQALDTSHYKRDAEANRRFIKINPNMAKEKYKAAARLIAENSLGILDRHDLIFLGKLTFSEFTFDKYLSSQLFSESNHNNFIRNYCDCDSSGIIC